MKTVKRALLGILVAVFLIVGATVGNLVQAKYGLFQPKEKPCKP